MNKQMEYYPAIKKEQNIDTATTRMNLEHIMLSQWS